MKEEITEVRKYLVCSFIAVKIKTHEYDGEERLAFLGSRLCTGRQL